MRMDESVFDDAMFLSEQGFILSWLYFGLVVQHHYSLHQQKETSKLLSLNAV